MNKKTQYEVIQELARDNARKLGSVFSPSSTYLGANTKNISDYPTIGVSEFQWATSFYDNNLSHCKFLSYTISGGSVLRHCLANQSYSDDKSLFYVISGCKTYNWQKTDLCIRGEHPTLWVNPNGALVASGYYNTISYVANSEDFLLNIGSQKQRVISSINGDFSLSNLTSGYNARYSVEVVSTQDRIIPLTFNCNMGNNIAIYVSGSRVFDSTGPAYANPTTVSLGLFKNCWTRIDIFHSVALDNAMFELNGALGRFVDGARIPASLRPPTWNAGYPTQNKSDRIELSWSNSTSDGGSSTQIYATSQNTLGVPSGYNAIASIPINSSNYIDPNLDYAITKYYKLRHVNAAGEVSDYSTIASGYTYNPTSDAQIQVIIGSGDNTGSLSTANKWNVFNPAKCGLLRIDLVTVDEFASDPIVWVYTPDLSSSRNSKSVSYFIGPFNIDGSSATYPNSHVYYTLTGAWFFANWDGTNTIFVSGTKYGSDVSAGWNLSNNYQNDKFIRDAVVPSGQIALFVGQDYVASGVQYAWNPNITIQPKRNSAGTVLIHDNPSGPNNESSGIYEARFSNDYNVDGWTQWESFTPASVRSWTLKSGSDGQRAVYAQFRDKAFNESLICSGTIYLDTTAPTAPTGLTVQGGATVMTVDWNDNPENDVDFYRVYGYSTPYTLVTGFPKEVLSSKFIDFVGNATTRHYRVTAVDRAMLESSFSGTTSGTSNAAVSSDGTPPSMGGTSPVDAANSDGTIKLTWNNATDASGVGSYKVFRYTGAFTGANGWKIADVIAVLASGVTSLGTQYTDSDVVNTQRYTYYLGATDIFGNEAIPISFNPTDIVSNDTTAPTAITIASGWGKEGRIDLWWVIPSGAGIERTRIDRSINAGTNYSEIARVAGDRYQDFLSGIDRTTVNSNYRWKLYTYDFNGLVSSTSMTLTPGANVLLGDYYPSDFTNPLVPASDIYASGDNDGRILLHWNSSTSIDTQGYRIKKHLHNKGTRLYTDIVDVFSPYESATTKYNYWFEGLVPSGGMLNVNDPSINYYYQFYLSAYDTQGNLSNDTIVTQVGSATISGLYAVDNTPPGLTTNLNYTISGLGIVNLTWTTDLSTRKSHIHVTEKTGIAGKPTWTSYDRKVTVVGSGYADAITWRAQAFANNYVHYRIFPEDKWGNVNQSISNATASIDTFNQAFPNQSDVASWASTASNFTQIDGGQIYTGTIIADKIAVYYREFDTNLEFLMDGTQTALRWRVQAASSASAYVWVHGENSTRAVSAGSATLTINTTNYIYMDTSANTINVTTTLPTAINRLFIGSVDTRVTPAAITMSHSPGTTIDADTISTGRIRAERIQIGGGGNLLLNAAFRLGHDVIYWGWNKSGSVSNVVGTDAKPAYVAPNYITLNKGVIGQGYLEQVINGGSSSQGTTITSGRNYILSLYANISALTPTARMAYFWQNSSGTVLSSGFRDITPTVDIGTRWDRWDLDCGAAPLTNNPRITVAFKNISATNGWNIALGAAQLEEGYTATPWKQGGMSDIDGSMIRTGTITANEIQAATITADRLLVGTDLNIAKEYHSSFESVPSGWAWDLTDGGSPVATARAYIVEDILNSGYAYHGKKSLYITQTAAGTGPYSSNYFQFNANRNADPNNASYGTWLNDSVTYDIAADGSKDYIASAYIRTFETFAVSGRMIIFENAAPGSPWVTIDQSVSNKDGWTRISIPIITQLDTTAMKVRFDLRHYPSQKASIYFDGFQLEPIGKGTGITDPSTFSAGGTTSIDGSTIRTGKIYVKNSSGMDVYIGDSNTAEPINTSRVHVGKWSNQTDFPNSSILDLRTNSGIVIKHAAKHDVTHMSDGIYRWRAKPSNYVLTSQFADYPVLLSLKYFPIAAANTLYDESAMFLPSGRMLFASLTPGPNITVGGTLIAANTQCGVRNFNTGAWDQMYLPLHILANGTNCPSTITNNHRTYLDGQMGLVISGFTAVMEIAGLNNNSFTAAIYESSMYNSLSNAQFGK